MNYFLPFLAVVLGYSFVTFFKPAQQQYTKLLLSFSGAYLLALTVFVLIPEVYHSHDEHTHGFKYIGLFVIVGVLLQIVLEFFSHGAEHGHTQHLHPHQHSAFPLSLFISLSIHSILEGFPLSYGHNHDLVYGIFVHKLPVAIVLTTFFINSGVNKWKTALFLLFFALMTPLGTFLSNTVPSLINYHTELSAIVIGIFLHISTVILFENSEGHRFNLLKFLSVCVGFAVAYLT
ncbi:ZIP Zinc transporter [Capnocytophaga ochracea]|uniref:ZIP Zinc transporter n=1 Tax=Capnocytophaga ochracea TaxID=1018 RepID=A0A7Z9CBX8_CAPOC|nr:ZIP family metal transporter [Capnocytophaga ochracea]VDG82115.1 ZIP Zinc transporter [Capnocytophaga ochracea]